MAVDTVALSMGSISEVKIANFNKVVSDATQALTNHRVSEEKKNEIIDTLNFIKSKPDYTITPDIAATIDESINAINAYVVSETGEVKPLLWSGSETFSTSLTPAEWRRTRVAGCESLLKDISKNILKWSKRLKERIHELWLNFNYNIESLTESIVHIDHQLANIDRGQSYKGTVIIPKQVASNFTQSRTMQVSGNKLKNDILYLLTVIKVWELESVNYKNRLIRYFGKQGQESIDFLYRKQPAFFTQEIKDETIFTVLASRFHVPEKGMGESKRASLFNGRSVSAHHRNPHRYRDIDVSVYTGVHRDPVGIGVYFFRFLTDGEMTLDDLQRYASMTGYAVIPQVNRVNVTDDVVMDVMSLSELDKLYDTIVKIKAILQHLNSQENPVVLSDKDVKDVLSSLSDSPEELMTAFSGLSDTYQSNTLQTQIDLFKHLFVFANQLVAFMSLHIKEYSAHDQTH